MTKRQFSFPLILFLLLSLLLAACGDAPATNTAVPAPTTAAQPTTAANVATYTAQEIAAASGKEGCEPLAAIPKTLKEKYTIGFINPEKGHPFWGTISAGMNAAAAFYGINFVEVDMAGDSTKLADLFETLLLSKPLVAGTGGQGQAGEAVAARAQEEGVTYMGLDSGASAYSPYNYGVPDAFAGNAGAQLLITGVEQRMASDWKSKELFFIEFTHLGVPACIPRTGAAAAAFKDHFKLDADHVLQADLATGQTAADLMTNILTAHPNAVFAMIPCWDGIGLEPYNTAKSLGREKDVMLVTLGGDKAPADVLITKPMGYYGYVEFQPFCEAWGWVETAIAIKEGVQFRPYQTRRTTTQAQIDARYKELYGDYVTPTPAP